MIKSYGICLQRPESPCAQHFLGSNPAPSHCGHFIARYTAGVTLCCALSSHHQWRTALACVHGLARRFRTGWWWFKHTHTCMYIPAYFAETSALPFPFLFLVLMFRLSAVHFAKARMYEMYLLQRQFSLQVLEYLIVRPFPKAALKVSYLFHN